MRKETKGILFFYLDESILSAAATGYDSVGRVCLVF